MTLYEKVDKALAEDATGDPRALAAALWPRVKREELLPLLVDLIAQRMRHDVREGGEREFHKRFQASAAAGPIAIEAADPGDAFRALFGKRLAFGPDNRQVVEDATRDDWLARRHMLLTQRNGIDRALAVCDAALERLDSTGARTLGDADQAAAA